MIGSVYLSESKSDCWDCGKETPVFCLCASGFEDEDNDPYDDYTSFFVTLSNLKHCGDDLKEIIGRHAPEYFKDSSKQAGGRYFMNHCKHCHAKLGDFFMHEEPGGSFFPTDRKDAQRVSLREIKGLEGAVLVSDGYGLTVPNMIYSYSPKGKVITVGQEEKQSKGFFRSLIPSFGSRR